MLSSLLAKRLAIYEEDPDKIGEVEKTEDTFFQECKLVIEKNFIPVSEWKSLINYYIERCNNPYGSTLKQELSRLYEAMKLAILYCHHPDIFCFLDGANSDYIDGAVVFNMFYDNYVFYFDPIMVSPFFQALTTYASCLMMDRESADVSLYEKIFNVYELAKNNGNINFSDIHESVNSFMEIFTQYYKTNDKNIDTDTKIIEDQAEVCTKILRYEKQLSESNYSIEEFYDYINYLNTREFTYAACGLFRRILMYHPHNDSLWVKFLTNLKRYNLGGLTYDLGERAYNLSNIATELCPKNVPILQLKLLIMEMIGISDNIIDSQYIEMQKVPKNANDAVSLFCTYVYMLKRRVDKKSDLDYTIVVEMFSQQLNELNLVYGENFDSDGEFHRKFAYFCYAKAKHIDAGRQQYKYLLTTYPHKTYAYNWLEMIACERAYGDIGIARELYKESFKHVVDDMYTICTSYVQFEREEGNLYQLDDAVELANSYQQKSYRSKRGKKRTGNDNKKNENPNEGNETSFSKRTKQTSPERPKPKEILALRTPSASPPHLQRTTPSPPVREKSVDKDGFVIPYLPARTASPAVVNSQKVGVVTRSSAKLAIDMEKTSLINSELPSPENAMEIEGVNNIKINDETNTSNTLFIKNLHFSVTEEALKRTIEDVCKVKVTSVRIPKHNNSKPKGIGYVDLASEGDIQKAVVIGNTISFNNRKIEVLVSNSPFKKNKECPKVVVKSLPTVKVNFSAPKQILPRVLRKKKLTPIGETSKLSNSTEKAENSIKSPGKMTNDDFKKLF
uniref:Squamous cell carcinoma antigen recognized by T-cells 3 (inferred by orthology to a human protein) n=1 Tax=Strongyloides venezuelensis TaxID=75913 RepID=A0A0K0FYQ9_STRVS